MKIPRIAVAAPAVVAVLAGGAYTVDAVSASRVEAEISARIAPEMPGAAPPSVMTGGPFTRWSEPGTLSSVSIRAERVARPGVAPVAVEAEATDLVATDLADTGLADTGLSAQSVVVSVQMIGDSLAQALDMRDVLIEAADDHSLAGEPNTGHGSPERSSSRANGSRRSSTSSSTPPAPTWSPWPRRPDPAGFPTRTPSSRCAPPH
ncbi:DUF2993 domain-containing protein [Dietzia aerolata]|uniref:DUF2993 domain-containing protein n=1 Tax=Dietzia aerolata TaxID=595984 RepID=UPI00363D19C3